MLRESTSLFFIDGNASYPKRGSLNHARAAPQISRNYIRHARIHTSVARDQIRGEGNRPGDLRRVRRWSQRRLIFAVGAAAVLQPPRTRPPRRVHLVEPLYRRFQADLPFNFLVYYRTYSTVREHSIGSDLCGNRDSRGKVRCSCSTMSDTHLPQKQSGRRVLPVVCMYVHTRKNAIGEDAAILAAATTFA